MTATFDSSAWLAFLQGDTRGRTVRRYLEQGGENYTSTISLLEIKSKFLAKGVDWQAAIDFIRNRSIVVDLEADIALRAADLKHEYGLSAIDAAIYATSRLTGSPLLTTDSDFSGLPDVVLL